MNVPIEFLKETTKVKISKANAINYFQNKRCKKAVKPIIEQIIAENSLFDSFNTAAEFLANTYNAFSGKASPATYAEVEKVNPNELLSVVRTELESLIGKVSTTPRNLYPSLDIERIDIINDLHIPFHNEIALVRFLKEANGTKLRILGDVMDLYSQSRYGQTIDYISMREEIAKTRAIMELFAKKYKSVEILLGNHDKRATRKIQNHFPQLMPLVIEPMVAICAGLENVTFMNTKLDKFTPDSKYAETFTADFMAVEQDRLYGHFENFCGHDAVRLVDRWIGEWEHILNFGKLKAVFQAHVHKLSLEFSSKGTALVATGCMCKPMPYQLENHGKFGPPVTGYVTFQTYKGNIIPDSIQLKSLS